MENFEEKLINDIQAKILKGISSQELIKIDYNDRLSLPKSLLTEVYQSLDVDNIKKRLKIRLEEEMADKIANKLITEYSNDIKQIMSNNELREDLRHYAREKIRAIADKVNE